MFVLDWILDHVRLTEDWEGDEDGDDEMEDEDDEIIKYEPRRSTCGSAKRVSSKQRDGSGTSSGREVCMLRPDAFDECRETAEYLLANRVVILDLAKVGQGPAQRIIDFVSGTIYAINGDFKQISQNIFIAAPAGTDLTGEFEDLVKLETQDTTWKGGGRWLRSA